MKNIDKIEKRDLAWEDKKNRSAYEMNPEELQRLLKEKKAKQKYIEEENIRMGEVRKQREEKYWVALRNHCLSGSLNERNAKFLVRLHDRKLLSDGAMTPNKRIEMIAQLERFHHLDEAEHEPTIQSFKNADQFMFDNDFFIHKMDLKSLRAMMFPDV